MRLMIDTNILLDVLENRESFVAESLAIWELCETGEVEGYINALSVANIIYILRKEILPEQIPQIYTKLSLVFKIASLDPQDISRSISNKWKDFEDGLQAECAVRIHADHIITRNIKDYINSKVPALTPSVFLRDFCRKTK